MRDWEKITNATAEIAPASATNRSTSPGSRRMRRVAIGIPMRSPMNCAGSAAAAT